MDKKDVVVSVGREHGDKDVVDASIRGRRGVLRNMVWSAPVISVVALPVHGQVSGESDAPKTEPKAVDCDFNFQGAYPGTGGNIGYWEIETAGGSLVSPTVGTVTNAVALESSVSASILPPTPASAALMGEYLLHDNHFSSIAGGGGRRQNITNSAGRMNIGTYRLYASFAARRATMNIPGLFRILEFSICGSDLLASGPIDSSVLLGDRDLVLTFVVDAAGDVTVI